MDAMELLRVALPIGIFAFGFATGLTTSAGDLVGLLRRPSLAIRSMLALFGVVPALVLALARVLALPRETLLALVLLAISPGFPMVPQRSRRMGLGTAYATSLVFVSGALAVVATPALFLAIAAAYGRELDAPVAALAELVGGMLLAPLLAGVLVRAGSPRLADRLAPLVTGAANGVWPGIGLVVVILVARRVPEVGAVSVVAMIAVAGVALLVGNRLGGPEEETRAVLAVATATRFPALALTLAATSFPGEPLVVASILVYFLVSGAVSAVYGAWWARARAHPGEPPLMPI